MRSLVCNIGLIRLYLGACPGVRFFSADSGRSLGSLTAEGSDVDSLVFWEDDSGSGVSGQEDGVLGDNMEDLWRDYYVPKVEKTINRFERSLRLRHLDEVPIELLKHVDIQFAYRGRQRHFWFGEIARFKVISPDRIFVELVEEHRGNRDAWNGLQNAIDLQLKSMVSTMMDNKQKRLEVYVEPVRSADVKQTKDFVNQHFNKTRLEIIHIWLQAKKKLHQIVTQDRARDKIYREMTAKMKEFKGRFLGIREGKLKELDQRVSSSSSSPSQEEEEI